MGEQLDLFGGAAGTARGEAAVRGEPATSAGEGATGSGAAAAALPESIAFEQVLEGFERLDDLAEFARGCQRCGLRNGCHGVVFGEGDPHAAVMLIGEGPGATEDELGRPFVGRAGELLDRILAAAGFRRAEVYISNVVLCRPPSNRTPAEDEIAACRPYLERRLALVRPAICVALGATAVRALVHPRARITQLRGQWHRRGDVWVMPTFHPAAVLRDPSKKRPVWEDFQAVRDLAVRLARARPSGA